MTKLIFRNNLKRLSLASKKITQWIFCGSLMVVVWRDRLKDWNRNVTRASRLDVMTSTYTRVLYGSWRIENLKWSVFSDQLVKTTVNPNIVAKFASLFKCTTVGRSSDAMTARLSVCFRWLRLTISVCGQAYRGPICGFLVFWLQIATELYCDVSQIRYRIPMRTEHIFVIWCCIRIIGEISREKIWLKLVPPPSSVFLYWPFQGGSSVIVGLCACGGGFICGGCFHCFITKTRLYNFDLLKPHFCIVNLEFTGVYMIFLISA